MNKILVSSYEQLSDTAAEEVVNQLTKKPDSVLALATGSTPKGMYEKLIERYHEGKVDFGQAYTVNLDEYQGLPAEHLQSYHYYMKKQLFDEVNIASDHIYIPNGLAEDARQECQAYDSLIERLNGIDLMVLGIGRNGHIAFNEPAAWFDCNTHLVRLSESTIQANQRFFSEGEEVPKYAYTMGMKAVMGAKQVLLLAGADKHNILKDALYGRITSALPASILQLHPNLVVICEEKAE